MERRIRYKIFFDWDYVFATLIHELAHSGFSYPGNKKLKEKTFGYIKKTFTREKPQARAHIPIIVLQLCVMAKVFPRKYQKMLALQKFFPNFKRVWEIVNKNKDKINLTKPLESILNPPL